MSLAYDRQRIHADEYTPAYEPRDSCSAPGCRLWTCDGSCPQATASREAAQKLEAARLARLAARKAAVA